jgi:hypothetical protein
LDALNELVEPSIRGDPEAALRWVSLSQRHLSAALAWHRDHRLSCPARHQQVEQNRASAVFLHHSELARQATDQLPGHRPSTTTDTGLTVACRLDDSDYAKGIKVTDAEMAALNIQPADFHGEWNYTIAPRWPDG